MSDYSEKLKDPRWQRKRLEILNRDNFTCVCCDDTTKTLHVHHIKYIYGREPWEYENELLETLCVDCHEAQTLLDQDLKAAEVSALSEIRKMRFPARLLIGDVFADELEALVEIRSAGKREELFALAGWTEPNPHYKSPWLRGNPDVACP